MNRLVTILDPEGKEITLPLWAVIKLQQAKFLLRDQQTGRKRIKKIIYGWLELFRGADPTKQWHGRRNNPLVDALSGPQVDGFLKSIEEQRQLQAPETAFIQPAASERINLAMLHEGQRPTFSELVTPKQDRAGREFRRRQETRFFVLQKREGK